MGIIDVESQTTLNEVVDRLAKVETQIAGVSLGQISKDVASVVAALEDFKTFIKSLKITIQCEQ